SPRVLGRLDEVTYEAIGKEMTSFQIDFTSSQDSNVKKLLYGVATSCIDICDHWPTVARVIPKDKFIGWGYGNIREVCFDYCVEQLRVVGKSMMTPWWGTSKAMNPGIYQL